MIFIDWNMPKMNGLEFIKYCRNEKILNNVPIIMLTAERGRESVMSALKEGATAYIVKPFKMFIIQQKLEQFLKIKDVA